MLTNRHSPNGFTIVELLVVIVVISILTLIGIPTYTGIQQRAQASAIVDQIRKVEKGLRLFATDKGISSWWDELSFTGYNDPSFVAIMASGPGSGLKSYLTQPANFSSWEYDNDGNTKAINCLMDTNGVNILIPNISDPTVAQLVDNSIDDGNVSCGKIRYDSANTRLIYNLALTATDM